MIRYIEGKLLKKEEDRIVVLANGVGYEILLPAIVRQTFSPKRAGEDGEMVRLLYLLPSDRTATQTPSHRVQLRTGEGIL